MKRCWLYFIATSLVTITACGSAVDDDNGNDAEAPAIGENLVESPEAEGDDPKSGWMETGCLMATDYGEGDGPGSSSEGPAERGDAYFSARDISCKDTVGAAQWIEGVSELRESGIGGDVPYDFELSGYLGGWTDDPDHATFSAYFLNERDRLLRAATIGPVTEADRSEESKLLERTASDHVPNATERIMLLLEFRRTGPGKHKGAADNLSFELREKED